MNPLPPPPPTPCSERRIMCFLLLIDVWPRSLFLNPPQPLSGAALLHHATAAPSPVTTRSRAPRAMYPWPVPVWESTWAVYSRALHPCCGAATTRVGLCDPAAMAAPSPAMLVCELHSHISLPTLLTRRTCLHRAQHFCPPSRNTVVDLMDSSPPPPLRIRTTTLWTAGRSLPHV